MSLLDKYDPPEAVDLPPTVHVGGWMTTCLACDENVLDGSDNTHKVAGGGYEMAPEKPGCGVVWTHLQADPQHRHFAETKYPGLIYAGL